MAKGRLPPHSLILLAGSLAKYDSRLRRRRFIVVEDQVSTLVLLKLNILSLLLLLFTLLLNEVKIVLIVAIDMIDLIDDLFTIGSLPVLLLHDHLYHVLFLLDHHSRIYLSVQSLHGSSAIAIVRGLLPDRLVESIGEQACSDSHHVGVAHLRRVVGLKVVYKC